MPAPAYEITVANGEFPAEVRAFVSTDPLTDIDVAAAMSVLDAVAEEHHGRVINRVQQPCEGGTEFLFTLEPINPKAGA